MSEFKVARMLACQTKRLLQTTSMTSKSGDDCWASILFCCIQLIMEPMRGNPRDIVEKYVDISLEKIKKIIFENLEGWDVKP